ncbi:hypothetical protein [Segatella buccae]|uniref:hypothetical protein n=1 Tax=Segatella buccae TaxID=28126 RepID=UPI0027BA4400|nr:hypothetical protein [Segatella buccae]
MAIRADGVGCHDNALKEFQWHGRVFMLRLSLPSGGMVWPAWGGTMLTKMLLRKRFK